MVNWPHLYNAFLVMFTTLYTTPTFTPSHAHIHSPMLHQGDLGDRTTDLPVGGWPRSSTVTPNSLIQVKQGDFFRETTLTNHEGKC